MVGLFQNDPLDDFAYTIEESQLAPGDSTILRLTNGSSSPVKYDICQSWADRRTSTGWTDADIRVSDFCFLLAPRSLEPGETASASIQIDSSAVEGVYRFSTDVEIKDSNRSIFTGTFRIEPEDR